VRLWPTARLENYRCPTIVWVHPACWKSPKEVDDAAELGPCSIRSRSRSPRSLPTAPTTRIAFTMLWPSTLRRLWLSCRRGRRPLTAPPLKPTQSDRHIQVIAEQGRMAWQKTSGYNARAGAEGTLSRYKRIIGDTLRSHSRPAQETRIVVSILNRMLDLGLHPRCLRIKEPGRHPALLPSCTKTSQGDNISHDLMIGPDLRRPGSVPASGRIPAWGREPRLVYRGRSCGPDRSPGHSWPQPPR
jgi:hypothetical protein